MASKQSTVDYIIDQTQGAGLMQARKMFGEYALYCDGKVIGLICDDSLFIKITQVSDKFLDESYESPPYPGAKNYLKVPEEKWDDRDWLTEFARQTSQVLPLPKSKKKRVI